MNKKMFFLILSVLGLVIWAVSFFFGFNYTQNGALMVSIPVALFVLALMGGMVYLMKRFCNPNGADNYAVAKNTERAALVIYIIVSLCTAIYVGHFVSVSMNKQAEIQDNVKKEYLELYRIYADKKSVQGSYVEWVEKQCASYSDSLSGFSQGTIDTKVNDLRNTLINKSGFTSLQREVNTFLNDLEASVSSWDWLTVSETVSILEANKEEWKKAPEQFALASDYTKNEPYQSNSQVNFTDIASPLTNLSGSDFSISAILLIIVLQVMILLTYISERPNGGRDPIKYSNSDFVRSYGAKKKPVPSSGSNRNQQNGNNQNPVDPGIILGDD